jgi:hypothetical protein
MSARPNGGGSKFYDDGGVMAGEPSKLAYIGGRSQLRDIKRGYNIERMMFDERDKK